MDAGDAAASNPDDGEAICRSVPSGWRPSGWDQRILSAEDVERLVNDRVEFVALVLQSASVYAVLGPERESFAIVNGNELGPVTDPIVVRLPEAHRQRTMRDDHDGYFLACDAHDCAMFATGRDGSLAAIEGAVVADKVDTWRRIRHDGVALCVVADDGTARCFDRIDWYDTNLSPYENASRHPPKCDADSDVKEPLLFGGSSVGGSGNVLYLTAVTGSGRMVWGCADTAAGPFACRYATESLGEPMVLEGGIACGLNYNPRLLTKKALFGPSNCILD